MLCFKKIVAYSLGFFWKKKKKEKSYAISIYLKVLATICVYTQGLGKKLWKIHRDRWLDCVSVTVFLSFYLILSISSKHPYFSSCTILISFNVRVCVWLYICVYDESDIILAFFSKIILMVIYLYFHFLKYDSSWLSLRTSEFSTKKEKLWRQVLTYTSMTLVWNWIFPVSRSNTPLVYIMEEAGFFPPRRVHFCTFCEQCLLRKFSE